MEDDEENLCKYGTPLPLYGEDEIPAKKPVSVEDQIVLDVNGKRRFHGAFTGGFSAGYWNTVGSEEGWKPTEFKSSRGDKSSFKIQKPMDFMDEEDLGEFGIAPQRVQAKEDFAHSSKGVKRSLAQINWNGPIAGQPVLRSLLKPAKEKTAICILKKMGWREGQGIGDRQTRTEKKKINERNKKEEYVMKIYGCALPKPGGNCDSTTDSDSDFSDYEITFAPDDFDPLVAAIKDNSFGLGYSGLQRQNAIKFNLVDTLEVVGRNNKKLSIRGQAFGVGALEDDDEDIYAKDDMSKYDFSLEHELKKVPALKLDSNFECLEGFCPKRIIYKQSKRVYRVVLPENFIPRNWGQRLSRFEPLNENLAKLNEKKQYVFQGLGRHELTPLERSHVLGETQSLESMTYRKPTAHVIERKTDTASIAETSSEVSLSEQVKKINTDPLKFDLKVEMSNLGSTRDGFKPFIADPDKQERYEKFISYKSTVQHKNNHEFLVSLQPLGMSEWDREREFKEFMQAQRMYRPLDGLMSDRFITESSIIAEKEIEHSVNRDVKMKRSKSMWKPHKDLCKRFNVPEPFGGTLDMEIEKPKTKFSVFDYLETPTNNKTNFVTPVIIPSSSAKTVKSVPVRVSAESKTLESVTPSSSFNSPQERKFTELRLSVNKKPAQRSELELRVLESVNKKPEEKKDLFKSIFYSSDEDDFKEANSKQSVQKSESSSLTASEKLQLIESLVAIKPASEINILRNNSPPRGIFKSILDIVSPAQPNDGKSTQCPESSHLEDTEITNEYYGPKLPSTISHTQTALLTSETNTTFLEPAARERDFVEKWVEKRSSSVSKGKKKKHKVHRKTKKHKKEKKNKR
ncbi:G patch domain-containing protein 1 homolog [Wyeomyia smithii]|uniref:G patch domain-containing protein 1 homolog n=1 Tax=Wyeomyia smithii TaxID=174621 RepID=UPI0024681D2F|nr:G patch domain-containing protein 1 homolog [Wyeomyia smithii]